MVFRNDAAADGDLVTLVVTGNPSAYGELYKRHKDVVFKYVLYRTGSPEEAADITAETFTVALKRLYNYKPEKGTFQSWVLGIASNLTKKFFRRRTVEAKYRNKLAITTPPDLLEEFVDIAAYNTVHPHLKNALDALPRSTAETAWLRVVLGFSYQDIAHITGVTEATARKRVSRGLQTLKQKLASEYTLLSELLGN